MTPARYDAVAEAAKTVQDRIGDVPDVAVVLGSGLGAFAGSLGDATVVPYSIIPHWPAAKIVGHAGELVAGTIEGRRVLALSGRAHVYEGHAMAVATFATRVLGLLGVKVLILTNAAGGINTSFAQGALMLISDHINLMGTNPLVGPNDERFGARFPDMTMAYSPRLRQAAREAAAAIRHPRRGRRLHRGDRPELRDAGRDPRLPHHGRRRGRDVHRARGDRRAAHGHRGRRHLVHHQHGGGRAAASRSCTRK